jgi:hypothetical protein
MDAVSQVGQRSADEKRDDQGTTRAKTRQEQKAPRFSGQPPIAPVSGSFI